MSIESNKNQNNNVLWLSFGLIGGGTFVYWLTKDKLNQKDQELNQNNLELKEIQAKVERLEQQLVNVLDQKTQEVDSVRNKLHLVKVKIKQWGELISNRR